jgi:thiol-disulfide isomerase/thioredoxin
MTFLAGITPSSVPGSGDEFFDTHTLFLGKSGLFWVPRLAVTPLGWLSSGPSFVLEQGAMKYLLYAIFTALAGTMFYSFIRSAQDGERRHSCTAACALRPEYADRNRLAPDFELPTLDGGRFRLSEHRGKVVVVNFWTKTCGPCLQEMPELAEFGQILAAASDKIMLVTVSTDESAQDARQTLMSVLQDGKMASPEQYKPRSSLWWTRRTTSCSANSEPSSTRKPGSSIPRVSSARASMANAIGATLFIWIWRRACSGAIPAA